MAQEIGESREAWGKKVMEMANDFASKMSKETKPYYIVYACKEDKEAGKRLGRPAFKQALRAYYARPPKLLGILVWYVNNETSEFSFVPELSSPPDLPVDPRLLSNKSEDFSERVMAQGENMNVLLS